jgi:hypothetical protein
MTAIELYSHQKIALGQLKTGSILCGGVGSGKSRVAIAYYLEKECPKDLYIITTASKRDTLDWQHECGRWSLYKDRDVNSNRIQVIVDSWNNIRKYVKIEGAFFIFDEQRVVGSGSWVRSFLKIVKKNNWILLSATPGDTWLDYIPVFIANGFYKNRTEFIRNHVRWIMIAHKYPKIDGYIEEAKLIRFKHQILVEMPYSKPAISIWEIIILPFDKDKFNTIAIKRWNFYDNKPIKDIGEYCHIMRKVVNSDPSRLIQIEKLRIKHRRIIIFYNFNYELDILHQLRSDYEFQIAEYNGHKHEPLPNSESWIYLVQYLSGAEGWNCIETNCIVFYSLNYSYRIMIQAAGRIDRLNTPFAKLYYYTLQSESKIDLAIGKALKNKKDFNENIFKIS